MIRIGILLLAVLCTYSLALSADGDFYFYGIGGPKTDCYYYMSYLPEKNFFLGLELERDNQTICSVFQYYTHRWWELPDDSRFVRHPTTPVVCSGVEVARRPGSNSVLACLQTSESPELGVWELWMQDDAPAFRQVWPGNAYQPAVSPDGRTLLFVERLNGDSRRLVALDIETGQVLWFVRYAEKHFPWSSWRSYFSFSRDSQKVIVMTYECGVHQCGGCGKFNLNGDVHETWPVWGSNAVVYLLNARSLGLLAEYRWPEGSIGSLSVDPRSCKVYSIHGIPEHGIDEERTVFGEVWVPEEGIVWRSDGFPCVNSTQVLYDDAQGLLYIDVWPCFIYSTITGDLSGDIYLFWGRPGHRFVGFDATRSLYWELRSGYKSSFLYGMDPLTGHSVASTGAGYPYFKYDAIFNYKRGEVIFLRRDDYASGYEVTHLNAHVGRDDDWQQPDLTLEGSDAGLLASVSNNYDRTMHADWLLSVVPAYGKQLYWPDFSTVISPELVHIPSGATISAQLELPWHTESLAADGQYLFELRLLGPGTLDDFCDSATLAANKSGESVTWSR